MSNSSLVNYTLLSPHCSKPRKNAIKKITIHHMAGNLSVETCGNVFNGSREASSNYGIGSDGRVGLYVEECNRAWTSSSPENDNQAVTIEVANDEVGGQWHVSDNAYNKLIELCVDICLRNNIDKLVYTGDTNGNLTRHNMFKNTNCPGPYLQRKFPEIANSVNAKLAEARRTVAEVKPTPPQVNTGVTVGSQVKFKANAVQYNGASIPSAYKSKEYTVSSINGDRAVLNIGSTVMYAVHVNNIEVIGANNNNSGSSYKVRVTADALNYRSGPGVQHRINGTIRDRGIYTIVEERNGWGRLKSGAGWINLSYTSRV